MKKDNQDLKEENYHLEGAKAIAQALRSQVSENYKNHYLNLYWEDSVTWTGDARTHQCAVCQDWYLYKDTMRNNLALYRYIYSVL